ncbi:MAG: DUF5995 family protein [Longimicrobiaceae bacterium]
MGRLRQPAEPLWHHPASSQQEANLPAKTIDQVIEQLDQVIDRARREKSRLGYFACLYRSVTVTVKEGIEGGRFEDGPRMERLDVTFANLYLEALEAFRRGARAPRSWTIAFEKANSWRPLILQHLLLGMNAHINFDLGVAAARTAPGAALPSLKKDFDEINALLGEMLEVVQDMITRVSPWMGILDRVGGRHDEIIGNFGLRRARDVSWHAAQRFATLSPARASEELDRLDRVVAMTAIPIHSPGITISSKLLLARAREPNSVTKVMEALS